MKQRAEKSIQRRKRGGTNPQERDDVKRERARDGAEYENGWRQ